MDWKKIRINIICGSIRLFGKLPLKFHYFVGDIISWVLSNLIHYRKAVIYTNIARSFPEMPYAEVKKTVKDFYRHLGEIFAEAIWFGASDYKRLHEAKIVSISNLEVLIEAYENSPSISVLSSHCGNWEIIGGMWGYNYDENLEFPDDENCIRVVYKKLRSDVWDVVMQKNRCAPLTDFQGMLETNSVLRYALKHRGKKCIYLYYTDQYPYATQHEVGTFLNQKTVGMIGSISLANKLGMSVLYMKMKRLSRGHYELTFIPIAMDASKDDPERILKQFYAHLEDEIREQPFNWLWSHKRWK